MGIPLKIGPITDLRNYQSYHQLFEETLLESCLALEIHLISSDLESPHFFLEQIENAAYYLKKTKTDYIAFHFLDSIINNIYLHDLCHENDFKAFYPYDSSFDHELKKSQLIFEGIKKASRILHKKVIAVIHEGIFLETQTVNSLTTEILSRFRLHFLENVKKLHKKYLIPHHQEIAIFLENSPPYAGRGTQKQHFIDQCLFDIFPRVENDEKIVFDISHGFMCHDYFSKKQRGVIGLDLIQKEYDYEPILNQLKKYQSKIGWFHLSDCTGFQGENEGYPLFQKTSVVEWDSMIPLLQTIGAPIILEIIGSEKDFNKIKDSLSNLSISLKTNL